MGGGGQVPTCQCGVSSVARMDRLHPFPFASPPFLTPQLYEAVQHYSAAIRLAPWAPVLYTNRALALLQRGWGGDALCALRDAETGECMLR